MLQSLHYYSKSPPSPSETSTPRITQPSAALTYLAQSDVAISDVAISSPISDDVVTKKQHRSYLDQQVLCIVKRHSLIAPHRVRCLGGRGRGLGT